MCSSCSWGRGLGVWRLARNCGDWRWGCATGVWSTANGVAAPSGLTQLCERVNCLRGSSCGSNCCWRQVARAGALNGNTSAVQRVTFDLG
jgi:hypothetical protein